MVETGVRSRTSRTDLTRVNGRCCCRIFTGSRRAEGEAGEEGDVVVTACWKWKLLSHVWLFATPWSIQSMEFSRPEYWSGYPFPSPGNLPNSGIKPRSSTLQVDSSPSEPPGKPKSVLVYVFKRCPLPYLTLKLPFLISGEKSLLKYIQLFTQEDSTTVSKFPLFT